MILRLAVRNLLRSPRRTILTGVAIFAGVAISIIGRGFVNGGVEAVIAGATDGTVGHVQLRPAGYPTQGQQYPVDALLELPPAARALLDREASAWTERLYFAPTAAHGKDSLRVSAIAFDAERDPKVFPRTLWKDLDGAIPRADERKVAMTPRLADLLSVKTGDTLVLQQRTHAGALNALEVQVSGIVRTGNAAIDGWSILVPRALANELIATELPSHISARLRDRDDAPAFAEKLKAAVAGKAEVLTWEKETEELIRLQEVRRSSLNMILLVLFGLAGFGIANTILMAAYERIREVGTLRSMGMTEASVLRLFLLEGALLGLFAGAAGAIAGSAVVAYWAKHPLDFSEVLEKQMRASVSMTSVIYTQLSVSTAVIGVLLAGLVAALASIYPARFASRMVPADAVRASS